jgi:hypothetical protein
VTDALKKSLKDMGLSPEVLTSEAGKAVESAVEKEVGAETTKKLKGIFGK